MNGQDVTGLRPPLVHWHLLLDKIKIIQNYRFSSYRGEDTNLYNKNGVWTKGRVPVLRTCLLSIIIIGRLFNQSPRQWTNIPAMCVQLRSYVNARHTSPPCPWDEASFVTARLLRPGTPFTRSDLVGRRHVRDPRPTRSARRFVRWWRHRRFPLIRALVTSKDDRFGKTIARVHPKTAVQDEFRSGWGGRAFLC